MNCDLLFVRHGQSEDDRLGIIDGFSDYDLTELGKEQSRLVAERLAAEFEIDVLYSGFSKRARQTADIIGSRIGLAPIYDKHLDSHNTGIRRGTTEAEAQVEYASTWNRPLGIRECFPGGECYADFHQRANNKLQSILRDHENKFVCVVTHAWVINAFAREFLGFVAERRDDLSIGVEEASIHVFKSRDCCSFHHGRKEIVRLNDISHLIGIKQT